MPRLNGVARVPSGLAQVGPDAAADVSAWKESKREDMPWKSKLATDTGSTKYVVRISDMSCTPPLIESLRGVEPYERI